MKKGQVTLGLCGRRYGLGFHASDSFVYLPPTSMIQAKILLMPASELERIVNKYFNRWFVARKNDIGKRKAKKLEQMLKKEGNPAKYVRERIKQEHEGVVKFWERSFEDIRAKATRGSLAGAVPRKTRGNDYNVSIYAYRTDQTNWKVECQCNENYFNGLKRGPKHVDFFCMHAMALLLYALQYPKRVEGLRTVLNKTNSKVRTFLKPEFVDDMTIAFFLLDRHILGRKLFDIDRAIIRRKGVAVYDEFFRYMFEENLYNAGFYVFVTKNIFSDTEGKFTPKPLKDYFESIANRLYDQGYRHNGFVIEFQGTEYETVAVEFISRRNQKGRSKRIRFVCWNGYPPLLVERKAVRKKIPESPFPKDFNPYANIEKNGLIFCDDCTEKNDYVKIEIARGNGLDWFKDLYRKHIDARNAHELCRRVKKNMWKRNFYYGLLVR
ncbi:hypothetical protein DRZ77_01910 [Candidatus Woesearchaeota archaeon]|nr:hypothetical protein [Candidatus Woesearchaeota archaeon]RLE40549.1 MAG: hypothetical protein DRZ77_01910 [Candidatus Woesearchaeota archaeon]